MTKDQARLKGELVANYSEALDELLAETEAKEDFRELEEAVEKLAEKTLPETLKRITEGKDFSPKVYPKV
jgi:DNA-binding HxlR family transcriptional regulator